MPGAGGGPSASLAWAASALMPTICCWALASWPSLRRAVACGPAPRPPSARSPACSCSAWRGLSGG
eukprot:9050466-Pyramimonas_sp.AAC.1